MSGMNTISIDESSHIVKIETGNRFGNVAVQLNKKGKALPYVGIGGHSSFSVRKILIHSKMWGHTFDTIKAMNTVLANGTAVRDTQDDYLDIFCAFRGTAPSFNGIMTSIDVETFATPSYSIDYLYTWDLDAQAVDTLDLLLEFGGELTFDKVERPRQSRVQVHWQVVRGTRRQIRQGSATVPEQAATAGDE
ncbi:hypothetical protein PQX77_014127 [Marasmius sp. AFHP31]|nr:hypothetical protein PQX77_014127 [Marasmius sp. AFHP31]